MGVLSSAIDLFYGARRARSSFEILNPQEPILLSAACKARHPAGPNQGSGWAFARRGALLVTDQRLLCGDWDIPIAEVERLSYSPFNGITSRGMVLTVLMRDGKSYQFGLSKPEEWLKSFPIEVHADSPFGPNQAVVWSIRVALAALILKEFF